MRTQRLRPATARDARPAGFDMTPMIDVTFQLIVFFLVANDLSRKEIVDLALPEAVHGTEDGHEPDSRVIVNLRRPAEPDAPPVVGIRGRAIGLRELHAELQTRADRHREGGPGSPSAVAALIRSDRDVPWRHVQFVMQTCAAPSVRIHRLQFATTAPAVRRAVVAGK